jgi:hypothetical protein
LAAVVSLFAAMKSPVVAASAAATPHSAGWIPVSFGRRIA